MLHLLDISKAYGDSVLFEGLSWHVGPGVRVGLVGRNGAGKTTLFRIVAGEIRPDEGEVVRAKRVTIGYLAQETAGFEGRPVLDVVLDAAAEVRALERENAELEAAMEAGEMSDETLRRYEEVRVRFEALGGYGVEAEARRILGGLGFRARDMDRPASELSGGWQMRIALARLLLQRPDLLLLDEPTNHLDLESLLWFEGFLASYPGSVVLISHDRYLLNRFATSIADLTPQGLDVYAGDYDHYLEEKALRRERQAQAAANQARDVAQVERFIERFRYKNTKAKAVQSRIRALEKLDRIEAPEDEAGTIRFRFPKPERSAKDVVVLDRVRKAYGDVVVYDGLDLVLRRGERIALVGPNGAGKSTLMKLLAGVLEPDGGDLRLGQNVSRAYFAQHQLLALDLSRTVLAEIESVADFDRVPMCRGLLGAFRFSGEDVTKQVSVLSGGEKARLALAKLLLRPASLLLLDEPTNHLDMPSREVLEAALEGYDGTLVVISHDRHFINRVSTEVLEVAGGEVRRFPGNYDDYVAKKALLGEPLLGRGAPGPAPGGGNGSAAPEADSPTGRAAQKERKRWEADLRNRHSRETRPVREELGAVEARIHEVEGLRAALDLRLADPAFYADAAGVQAAFLEKRDLEREETTLLERWEALSLHLEAAESEYKTALEAGP